MSERTKNATHLLVLVAGVLCLIDGWAGWQWVSGRDSLALARDQAANCEDLGTRIESLRQAPAKVEETARTGEALARLVESSAQQVGLPSDHIVHVAPAEPRRIGESPYLEQSTAVELRSVTLRQLIEFSLSVARKEPRIRIPTLALRTPPGEAKANNGHELWNVQLTLTAHVFAPKMPTPP
jgi:hypothetical protein